MDMSPEIARRDSIISNTDLLI